MVVSKTSFFCCLFQLKFSPYFSSFFCFLSCIFSFLFLFSNCFPKITSSKIPQLIFERYFQKGKHDPVQRMLVCFTVFFNEYGTILVSMTQWCKYRKIPPPLWGGGNISRCHLGGKNMKRQREKGGEFKRKRKKGERKKKTGKENEKRGSKRVK